MNKLLPILLLLVVSACAITPEKPRPSLQNLVDAVQDRNISCNPDYPCGVESPFLQVAQQNMSTAGAEKPTHTVIMLDQGQDSLLLRLHMIESAKHSIEMQMFIFDLDESGTLVLDALIRAAKRGVKVRLLFDQLYGLNRPSLQAQLAVVHKNFELKLYSPIFEQAGISKTEFFAGVLFQYKNINKRMHNKLLLVDDQMAMIGGRNIQDRYFDWSDQYNYRDRDIWVAGPVAVEMRANFDAFWYSEKSFSAFMLSDVMDRLELAALNPSELELPRRPYSSRMYTIQKMSWQGENTWRHLQPYRAQIHALQFYSDLPEKHQDETSSHARASNAVYQIITQSKQSVIMQTPYLVMSRTARRVFRELQKKPNPIRVWVSTNSLAATDAFPVYALSHKYKRLYLRELGFHIYEFKPFPVSAPMRVGQSMGWIKPTNSQNQRAVDLMGYTDSSSKAQVPLSQEGVRAGMHAKSIVIDNKTAIIGSHNFDPRSDDYNTENLLVIEDERFSAMLSESIRHDMLPENAWVVAPRESLPALANFNYSMGKLSEKLPIFDIWPWPYATSYQLKPECTAITYDDPAFDNCADAVGDFPEVNMSLKGIYTRIISVFGAGLEPIL